MIKNDPGLTSKDEIAAFVTYLLGDEKKDVPFYYEQWGDGKRKSVSLPMDHGNCLVLTNVGAYCRRVAFNTRSSPRPFVTTSRTLFSPLLRRAVPYHTLEGL